MIGIDDEAVAARAIADRADMGEVGLLRIAQIGDQRAGRLNRSRSSFEAEAFEAVRLELVEQCATRGFGFEAPAVSRRDGRLDASQRHESIDDRWLLLLVRHDDLARAAAPQLRRPTPRARPTP